MKACSEVERRRAAAAAWDEWAEWEEVPCDIGTFIRSPEYLGIAEDVRPAVEQDLIDLFDGEYDEAVFVEAIGAGKSYKSSIILTYQAYCCLCLKNPAKTLGLARKTQIAFMNMATSSSQARDVVFGEIKNRIDDSPWFQNYAPPDPRIKSRIRFPKKVNILPGGSSSKQPLGYNVLGGIMDEAAFYHDPSRGNSRMAKDQAEEIYSAITRRIKSRFGHLPKRYQSMRLFIMISSPRYEDDFIERKYEEARTNPRIFARRRPLWEAMPPGTYSKKTFYDAEIKMHIPIDFQEDWTKNAHAARRDFGAQPSAALNPFMDWSKLKEIMGASSMQDPALKQDEFGYPGEFAEWFKGDPRYRYVMHIDLGLSRDACGIAMGHWDPDRVKAVIDWAHQIRTSKKKVLQFARIRAIIFELRRLGFRIILVSYDNFQSVDSRQILESKGIPTEHLSCDKSLEPSDTFLAFVNQGELDIAPNIILLKESRRLELIDGKKVDHPPNGSKDVWDAVVGVSFHLGMMRTEAKPMQKTVHNRGRRRRAIAGVGGRR